MVKCSLLKSMLTPIVFLTICLSMTYAQRRSKNASKEQTGWACMYSNNLHGGKTASGERFDIKKLTAAHLKYPLGTEVKVTNINTGKSVVVKINDRGPYSKKFIIDLSPAAAKKIGFSQRQGITKVRIVKV